MSGFGVKNGLHAVHQSKAKPNTKVEEKVSGQRIMNRINETHKGLNMNNSKRKFHWISRKTNYTVVDFIAPEAIAVYSINLYCLVWS